MVRTLCVALIAILLAVLIASHCSNLIVVTTSIDDVTTIRFFRNCLREARSQYGEPKFPIRYVNIVNSKASRPSTISTNLLTGEFKIEIVCEKSDPLPHVQLAHETMHLLNPRLLDVYVEGLNNVFAQHYLRKCGFLYEANLMPSYLKREPFYDASYQMMTEVEEAVGAVHLNTLLQYSVPTVGTTRMHIDINRWLKSLPDESRSKASTIIKKHVSKIKKIERMYFLFFDLPLEQD